MFKQENRIWWYMVGIIILMVLLLVLAQNYFIPVLLGQRSLFGAPFIYNNPPGTVISVNEDYGAELRTNYGTITVDLLERNAPKNVNNFAFLAGEGYYNGTRFHRLIKGLLVQGGDRNTLDDDPNNDGFGSPGYFIDDEVNWASLNLSAGRVSDLTNRGYESDTTVQSVPLGRYVLAMASAGPNTNGSQFFFVLAAGNDPRVQELNGQYTVIGTLLSGADVLNAIDAAEVDDEDPNIPRPIQPVILEQVSIFTR